MSAKMSASLVVGAAYPAATAPDFNLGFQPDYLLIWNTGANDAILSFDGVNDHVLLQTGATAGAPLRIETRATKIWLKQSGGASNVRISALTRS